MMNRLHKFGWWLDSILGDYLFLVTLSFVGIMSFIGSVTGNENNNTYWKVCIGVLFLFVVGFGVYAFNWRKIHPAEAARRDAKRQQRLHNMEELISRVSREKTTAPRGLIATSRLVASTVKYKLRDRQKEEDPISLHPESAKVLWISATTLTRLIREHPELETEAEQIANGIYEYEYGGQEEEVSE